MHCQILLIFDWYAGAAWILGSLRIVKIHFRSNPKMVRPPNSAYLNRNSSAADFSILLKFGTKVDHATADKLTMFKIKVSKVEVTA